jgi:membrane fusion protein (multidrug efflux system)
VGAAPVVTVTPVIQKTVPKYAEYVGQTESPVSVEIRARVEGFIQEIAFTEGNQVKEGDLLFVIDPKPYEEKLARAKGRVAEAEANRLKVHQDVERFRPLAKIQAIAQRDFDNAVALEKQAQAMLDAAQAELRSAELNLSYATMRSPVNGRIGSTDVRVGTLVGRGESTLLATISNTDHMWVSFGISEVEYLQYTRRRLEDPEKKQEYKIELVLADGSIHPHPGKVNFADRAIDPKTGTLRVRVEFPNPQDVLRPGQFARVRVLLEERPNAMVVPAVSVQSIQGTFSVMVVDSNHKVSFRPVKPGLKFGEAWVIEEGVKPGDLVIVGGLQRVRDGMTVQPTTVSFPKNSGDSS